MSTAQFYAAHRIYLRKNILHSSSNNYRTSSPNSNTHLIQHKYHLSATQSSFLQHKISQLTQQHIIRQQHDFTCSKHYPDFNSLSLLVKHCHEHYLNNITKNKAYLFILLSFLTGVPIEQWLNLQTNQRRALNKRQQLILENDQYFLRSKFTLFEDPAFEYKDQLLNQVTHFDLPLIKRAYSWSKAISQQ